MKAPKPPDPWETASAQTQANQSQSLSQLFMNMMNQNTPYGSQSYDQTGTWSYYDPILQKQVELPRFTQSTQLSPEQQKIFDQQQQLQRLLGNIAFQQTGKVGDILNTPFNFKGPGVQYDVGPKDFSQDRQKVEDALMSRLNPQIERDRAGLETQLVNQGLARGSEAFNQAMEQQGKGATDARMQAILAGGQEQSRLSDLLMRQGQFRNAAQGQGFQEALTERNQPLNEIIALMSGSQIQQPQFGGTPQTGMNGVDIAGLINQEYQSKLQGWQSQMGGLFGLGGSLLGGLGGWMFSDKNLKKDIKKIGKLDDGTKLYSYKYKGDKGGLFQLGVMAQEAEKRHPEAVADTPKGKMVNYSRLAEALAA